MNRVFFLKPIRIGVLLGASLLFYSCAAIISGANQNIKVKTEPKGATVYVNGQNTYKQTPCKVKVERRQKRPTQFRQENKIEIEVKKEGYQDAKLILNSSFNVVSVGSIMLAGVPFFADLIVGAHLRYPRYNFLAMEPLDNTVKTPLRPIEELTHKPESLVCDIDKNIPRTNHKNNNKFALIVGNEHYAEMQSALNSEVNVSFAINDANIFKQYAIQTLGVPEQNIVMLLDATLAQMQKGITKLKLLAKNNGSNSELYFYYAGHGLPHQTTFESYLLPVDLAGSDIDMAINLNQVYTSLNEFPAKQVTCILDCCFSGGARNQQISQARGVKIIPKTNPVTGNMVVLTASSGNQTAHAYNQKGHGLFTYFLLKKLQDTKGNVSLGELQNYLSKEVSVQSILLNDTEQYPQLIYAPEMEDSWKARKF